MWVRVIRWERASDDEMERLGVYRNRGTGSGRCDAPGLRAACSAYVE